MLLRQTIPWDTALPARSEPSVAIRICLYIVIPLVAFTGTNSIQHSPNDQSLDRSMSRQQGFTLCSLSSSRLHRMSFWSPKGAGTIQISGPNAIDAFWTVHNVNAKCRLSRLCQLLDELQTRFARRKPFSP